MKKKGFLISLLALCAVTCVVFASKFAVNAQQKTEENPFQSTYELGETVRIVSREIEINGTSHETVPVVICPSGNALSSEEIKLSEAGLYTVEYRATVNGRTYKECFKFTVEYPMFGVTTKSDTVEYRAVTVNKSTQEGLFVKLGSGSTFECNQAIDLTEMEKGDNLISMYIIPDTYGAADCNYFYLQLTDALDESNYITVCLRASPTDDKVIYSMAKAHNQEKYWGVENGVEGDAVAPEFWGFAARGSFSGEGFGSESYKIMLSYDNDTQTLYMENNYYANGGNYVIDFNNSCFTESWSGFESGKIFVSAYAGTYSKRNMGFLITSLAQVDLTQKNLTIGEPSGINIDFGDYTEKDYPHAVVGKPYRIFDAMPDSLYTSERVLVSVKTSYGSSVAVNVDIKDGCFTPESAITHTIVYTCIDGFGNKKEYALPVTVDESYAPVDFDLDTSEISAEVGSWIDIPKIDNAVGGNGKLFAEIILKNNATKEEIVIEKDSYRLINQGEFTLIYTVSDYNGCYKQKEIAVKTTASAKPIFEEVPVLPMVYIKGAKYGIPTISADDFSSGNLQKVSAAVKVYGDGVEIPVNDGYFVANANTNIKLEFTATDTKGQTDTKSYTVGVVDTGFTGKLDLTKYFIARGGEVLAEEKTIVLSATQSNAEYSFIRELNGKKLSATFALKEGATNYHKLTFRLTDAANSDKKVNISLTNSGGNAAISVNGGMAVKTKYKFGGDVKDYNLELNETSLFLCNEFLTVKTYADGSPFAGFEKFVYLTITMEACAGDAQVVLKNINKQSMNNTIGADITEPNIIFLGARSRGERELNSVITVDPVLAIDVLDPFAKITFSVRLPSKEYATALDGTLLKNVPSGKVYQIKLDTYGAYTFNYTYADSNDNEESFTMVVSCLDKIAPEISVEAQEISGKIGEALQVPKYTVTDNYSDVDAGKITTLIQIITPEGIYISYNPEKGYVFDRAGVYTLRYYVFDENFNVQSKNIVCKVS